MNIARYLNHNIRYIINNVVDSDCDLIYLSKYYMASCKYAKISIVKKFINCEKINKFIRYNYLEKISMSTRNRELYLLILPYIFKISDNDLRDVSKFITSEDLQLLIRDNLKINHLLLLSLFKKFDSVDMYIINKIFNTLHCDFNDMSISTVNYYIFDICSQNDIKIINLLLKNKIYNKICWNQYMEFSCEYGHVKNIEFLLNPSIISLGNEYDKNDYIKILISSKKYNLIEMLMRKWVDKLNFTMLLGYSSNSTTIDIILNNYIDKIDIIQYINNIIIKSLTIVIKVHMYAIKKIINICGPHVISNENILKLSNLSILFPIVEIIVFNIDKLDDKLYIALLDIVINYKRFKILKILLKREIYTHDQYNKLFDVLCAHKSFGAFEILLKQKKYTHEQYNKLFNVICANNKVSLLILLLTYDIVLDPLQCDTLDIVCNKGYIDIINILLSDSRSNCIFSDIEYFYDYNISHRNSLYCVSNKNNTLSTLILNLPKLNIETIIKILDHHIYMDTKYASYWNYRSNLLILIKLLVTHYNIKKYRLIYDLDIEILSIVGVSNIDICRYNQKVCNPSIV